MKKKPHIHIIGACLDLGSDRRGVDMGPSALRVAGINEAIKNLGYRVVDEGNISSINRESTSPGRKNAKYLKEIEIFCKKLKSITYKVSKNNHCPVVLGGDHTVAIGSVSGVARHYHEQKKSIGLIWVDAHADMNTPKTSQSGNVHGMPLAVLQGRGPKELLQICSPHFIDPHNCALIGIRSIDKAEKRIVQQQGVYVATMRDIDERSLKTVMDEATIHVSQHSDGVYLSLDIDACDPRIAPGVGTPVMGGLTYREAHLIMELISDTGNLLGCDIVEINPTLDNQNSSAQLGVELIASLFGKRIL